MKKRKLKRLLNEALEELGTIRSRLSGVENRIPPRPPVCGTSGSAFWFIGSSVPSPDLVTRDMVRQMIAAEKKQPVSGLTDAGVSTGSAFSPSVSQSPEPFPESFTRHVDLSALHRTGDCQHGTHTAEVKQRVDDWFASQTMRNHE